MRYLLFILSCLIGTNAFASSKPEATWLIDPQDSNSPRIQIWAKENSKFDWRLVRANGDKLAEMEQPAIPAGYSYNQGECHIDGSFRWDIIASVKHSAGIEFSTEILEIWAAMPMQGRFEKISFETARCVNSFHSF